MKDETVEKLAVLGFFGCGFLMVFAILGVFSGFAYLLFALAHRLLR